MVLRQKFSPCENFCRRRFPLRSYPPYARFAHPEKELQKNARLKKRLPFVSQLLIRRIITGDYFSRT